MSLIELLVVLTILAILAVPIAMRGGFGLGREASAGAQFARALEAHYARAIAQRLPQVFEIAADGWAGAPEGATLLGQIGGVDLRSTGRIVFFADGRVSPFRLRVGADWLCESQGLGRPQCAPV